MNDRFRDHPLMQRMQTLRTNPSWSLALIVQTERDIIFVLEEMERLAEENDRLRRVTSVDDLSRRLDKVAALAEQNEQMLKILMGRA